MSNSAKDPEKAMEVVNNEHDSEEEVEDEEAAAAKAQSAQLLKNPAVMAALQGKLNSMVGNPSGYIQVGGREQWKPKSQVSCDECHCGYF